MRAFSDGSESEQHARSPRRAEIPQRDYAHAIVAPHEATLQIIGHVRSPYRERFGTPRQPSVTENVLEGREQDGTIELIDGNQFDAALDGLEGFEYCWVISWLHLNKG